MRTKIVLASLAALAGSLTSRVADASCVPGFDYAAFGKDSVKFGGGASTDSYNSKNGSYAATKTNTDGDLGTNGDACSSVELVGNSTVVNGDVSYGDTGSACAVSGSGNVNGTKTKLAEDVVLPPVSIPTIGTAQGNKTIGSHGTLPLSANLTYGSVKASGGSHIVLNAGTYVMSSLDLAGNSDISVMTGPVLIYISCTSPAATQGIDLSGGTVINSTGISTNLVFMVGPACTAVKVTGGTTAAFAIYAPGADVTMTGGADIYGAVVGKTITNMGGSDIHRDKALETLAIGDFTCSTGEVSRASPVVATISNTTAIVQGTYTQGVGSRTSITSVLDLATFVFPFYQGHLRARTTASVTTVGSTFGSATILFDAGASGKIPTPSNTGCSTFNGTCRQLFTVTQSPGTNGVSTRPPLVQFKDSNASTIGALLAPTSIITGITATHWQTLVRAVLTGKLGGIDRSTAAVIGPSTVTGLGTRPTIAYVGATDGMLHAVCASVGGTTETQTNVCPSLGTELWAFMPRVQLPLVRSNLTRLDGSVRVIDAFGDFSAAQNGTKSFRTILTLQTGYANLLVGAKPAVYALDVTDPANPIVVWEYTAPTSTTFELGVGLAIAAGPTLVGNKVQNLVVAQTTNGGSGGAGVVATALSLETGVKQWQFGYAYPFPARGVSADGAVPSTGIPGGAVGVDLVGQGFTSAYVMGDLYGDLWRLDAATGASFSGTGVPMFRHSSNKKPIGAMPAVYSDGSRQYAVFGTGGYVDPSTATWASGTQSLISLNLAATGPYPITESSTKLAFKQDLGTGERAFAQALIVGGEIFLATDTTDVNAATFGTLGSTTGKVMRYDIGTNVSSSVVVRGGASSIAASSTTLYASSSDRQQQLFSNANSAVGSTVDSAVAATMTRLMWVRVD